MTLIEEMICFLTLVFLNVTVYIIFNFMMHFIKCKASINLIFFSLLGQACLICDLCCAHCT